MSDHLRCTCGTARLYAGGHLRDCPSYVAERYVEHTDEQGDLRVTIRHLAAVPLQPAGDRCQNCGHSNGPPRCTNCRLPL
jgi:hypothetical protein